MKHYLSDAGDDFYDAANLAGGPLLEPLPPGRKDGVVESKNRRLKETVRCIISSLKFNPSDLMIKKAVVFAAYVSNIFPTREGYKGVSPREALTGVKIDQKTHLPCAFGEFCWVVDKKGDNTLRKRTFPGIALVPTGMHGGVQFLNLETNQVVIRDQFTKANEIPKEYDEILASMAKYTKEEVMEMLGPIEVDDFEEDELIHEVKTSAIHLTSQSMEEEAEMKEFFQFKEKGVLKGIEPDSDVDPKLIIPLKIFSKEKRDTDGNIISIKSRGVARGDKQEESIYERRGSPTASVQSIFTLVTVGEHEGKRICTYDFPGAYLNSKRGGRVPDVYIRLNKKQTALMVRVNPEWRSFVRKDGTSVALCEGALYGLVESGRLWNEDVDLELKSMGFTQSRFDRCVYLKPGMRMALYVDDLLITYDRTEDIIEIKEKITAKFGGSFKFPVNEEIDFLGMKFKAGKSGGVSISMPSKIDDVLEGITGKAETPAGMNLFSVDISSQLLDTDEKKFFHSTTAKLLYIAKRTRPDVLLAVNFLTTRVQLPTQEDKLKLIRVLKYLNGTRDRELYLRIGKTVQVHAYIDASYGAHDSDGKSHSGAMIGIGEALSIQVKSSKQKIVTKSSTEAELVAVTDMAGEVMDLQGFIQELGYTCAPPKIYQDNTSTVHLLQNDFVSTSKSKHVRIRTFWIRERVQEGDVTFEHTPTDQMLADGLTKPLQGSVFKAFRDAILGKDMEE